MLGGNKRVRGKRESPITAWRRKEEEEELKVKRSLRVAVAG